MSTALAVTGSNGPPGVLSASQGINAVRETMDTLKAIRTFVKEEMVPNLDFGVIPGTGQKPALLQPGAQKTALYFNATPDHQVDKTELGNGHVEFLITTRLVSRVTGVVVGMGLGSCSTMEKKYRYRNTGRKCPACNAEAIIKGNAEWNNGVEHFLCHKKRGGCGAKFRDDNREILGQTAGQVDNPDVYDARNTVLKMAVKRSFVAAALSLGCLSELFTQDIDETYDIGHAPEPTRHAPEPERDDRRREVNEQFPQRGQQRPQARSGAKDLPPDEEPEPMPQPRPSEQSWASYVARVCTERRDYWGAELAMAKIAPADRNRHENEMPNQHEVTNHFVSHGIQRGVIAPESITKDGTADGPRDPAKAKQVMADLFRRAPRKVMAAVDAYFAERERAMRVRLGMDDMADDTQGQDVAEETSQEPTGREPGEDG